MLMFSGYIRWVCALSFSVQCYMHRIVVFGFLYAISSVHMLDMVISRDFQIVNHVCMYVEVDFKILGFLIVMLVLEQKNHIKIVYSLNI